MPDPLPVRQLDIHLAQPHACGAAGPASAPGLSLGRPAQRTPGLISQGTQIKVAQMNTG
jgi:hypothetical protein